jgi:penicillin-binding protein 2
VWRLGDTYITSIGQFGFQVSPIQMLRSVSAIANSGVLYQPILIKQKAIQKRIDKNIPKEYYKIIREAMRDTVTKGTAQNINVDFMDFAAKTGTAQVGVHNEFYNSWIIGFFPAKKPKYAFVVTMEKGKKGSHGAASKAMSDFIHSVQEQYPEFWESIKNGL